MKKEVFLKAMNALKQQSLIDIRTNKGLDMIFKNSCFITLVENTTFQGMIDLLAHLTGDDNEWIEYFIYELEWGKRDGEVKINNKKVPFETIEDLWNVLNEAK